VSLPQLRRIRWAVRAALILGVAASVTANVLHAADNPISRTIAAWPPLALLLTIELVAKVPVHRRSLAAVRLLATVVIAGIAAWVSYWHMAGVAHRYGESATSGYLLPVSVDGLVIVACVSLVELAGRIRAADRKSADAENLATDLRKYPGPETSDDTSARSAAAVKVARAHARYPDLSHVELAKKAGVSLSTVTRHRPVKPDVTPSPNGKAV
jgi:hypothetical protein